MPMPEASMHKYHGMVTGKYNVRRAWQIAGMKPEPEAMAMQTAPDQDFRSGITSPDAGHHPASGSTVYYIDHQAKRGNANGMPSRSCAISD